MQIKSLILFMPSIEGGGVEKNLIIISSYFSKKIMKFKNSKRRELLCIAVAETDLQKEQKF